MTKFHFKDFAYLFELAAFIYSFICLKRGQPLAVRLFPLVLSLVFFTELTAAILRFLILSNSVIYNLFLFLWFPGYLSIFYLWLEKAKIRKIILIIMVLFFIFSFWDFYDYGISHWIAHRTHIFGSCCLAISSVFALWELTNKKVPVQLSRNPLFWFSISVLAYFFPVSILLSVNEYIKGMVSQNGNAYARTYIQVNAIFNMIHYSLLCVTFYFQNLEWKNKNA